MRETRLSCHPIPLSPSEHAPFSNRTYRSLIAEEGKCLFQVTMGETNLLISADRDLSWEARTALIEGRSQIIEYIRLFPAFKESLEPLPLDNTASPLVQQMLQAAIVAKVGPMAAVAGAIAEHVGRSLSEKSTEVIVENGGDIFLLSPREITVAVHAGRSPFSEKIGLRLLPSPEGLGLCTSSASVGPSLSFGKADAATVISHSCALADAAATALGNSVKSKEDLPKALEKAMKIQGVEGALVIIHDVLGAKGNLQLVNL